ncbi:Npun_R2821/Npun_R2822 family protein [Cyanobacterium sp. IPPAS B-1200]|uniref:Npun_R2821/Npun_R2822 family protein n=1 Tax=Cyanobacterium sp. IPPAS B-1200 TaxID=1562720 RepID=UPI0008525906|nr:Npun_R2821/Npun_R2822 family protein [Cyanobacterium sp. IPPAS B-1200]OEJ77968.1 methionine synthase [Cyanobacterium sp. IPPAS B-1200]
MKGIYIVANDKVINNSIALLNSIRLYDSEVPITLIPYDDNYHEILKILSTTYQVNLYADLGFIDTLSNNLHNIFGQNFFARPNQFRKQACWFGEYDEFLYIDTDIVVFEKIISCLDYLKDNDFITCDYQGSKGIRNIFSEEVINRSIFTSDELKDVFNCGFWGSKKDLISEDLLYETFKECSKNPEYFDFSQKTSDQPIINYLVLKQIPRRLNLTKISDNEPGSWASSKHFTEQDHKLYDKGQPLRYLHWVGVPLKSGGPYYELWKHYRYLGEETPVSVETRKKDYWQGLKNKAKSILKGDRP